jgi:hypothetical protein
LSAVALGGLVPTYVACSSSNDSSSSSSVNGGPSMGAQNNSSSSTQTTTGTDGGGTTATPGACTATVMPATPAPTSAGVLDDMSGMTPKTGNGYWYTYSERSVPNSEPPIFTTDAGTVDPLEGTMFGPDNNVGDPGQAACVPMFTTSTFTDFHYREFTMNAIPPWGAGFGLDLNDLTPDGGPVILNSCDAGTIFDVNDKMGNTGLPQPFNASMYGGISFWGISLGSSTVHVAVQMDDAQTDPWGGMCDVCLNGGMCKTTGGPGGGPDCPCSDSFLEQFSFKPGVWQQFVVKFDDATNFKPANWSKMGLTTFDPSTLYNVHFQVTVSTGKSPAVDIAVADLEWVAK